MRVFLKVATIGILAFPILFSPAHVATSDTTLTHPAICDTELYLVYNPDGANVTIKCKDNGDWQVRVKYHMKDCAGGTEYAVGIVQASSAADAVDQSSDKNVEWFEDLYASAICEDDENFKFSFDVKYKDKREEYKIKVKD